MGFAVIFRTHKLSPGVIEEFLALTLVEDSFDAQVMLSYDCAPSEELPDNERFFHFCSQDIPKRFSKYNAQQLAWYNPEFCAVDFYRRQPQFDFYWLIEYDVRFRGDWRRFFRLFENDKTDFITSCIKTLNNIGGEHLVEKDWVWWDQKNFPVEEQIGCFFPINRFSNKALATLSELYEKGCHGYAELIVPSLIYNTGGSVKDMSEHPHIYNADYMNGRFTEGLKENFLHHPIRD